MPDKAQRATDYAGVDSYEVFGPLSHQMMLSETSTLHDQPGWPCNPRPTRDDVSKSN